MATANGFRAARHLNGTNCFETESYIVDDDNPKPIFQGHAVTLTSGRVVEHTSTGAGPILGIVKACYSSTENRPLTFSLPSTGNFIPASTRGFVDVYVDPDIIFEVVADSGMNVDDLGRLCDITATGSGNPTTGISRMQIDTTTLAVQTSANIQTLPFRAIGLSRRESSSIGSGFGVAGGGVTIEVMMANSVRRQAFPT